MKSIVIFGSLKNSQEYSRNQIMLNALQDMSLNLKFCTTNLGYARSDTLPVKKMIRVVLFAPFRWSYLALKYLFLTPADCDIVFIPYPSHIDGWLGIAAARMRKQRIIIDSFLGLYDTIVKDRKLIKEHSSLAALIRWYENGLLKMADCILVDTNEHAEMLSETYRINEGKIKAIPVGIDETLWQRVPNLKSGGHFTLVFWGTFIPLHGTDVIADAAKILSEQSDRFRFTIIGNGQTGKEFQKKINQENIRNIDWIDTFIPLEQIQKIVSKSDCCLGIFGKSEKTQRVIPYKVYQALASGKPLITAHTKAVSKLLINGKNAILIPPNNPHELAQAIRYIAGSDVSARKIGENGRKLYEEKLSNRVVHAKLKEMIME